MLAVFGKGKGSLQRVSGKRRKSEALIAPEEEETVNAAFNRLYESLPKRQRGFVQEHICGGGANGIAWADSLTTTVVHNGDVSTLFSGTLANNPTELEDAEYLLEEYLSEGIVTCRLGALPSLEGSFGLIIHDRTHGRVLAARDAEGAQPLFWGTNKLSGVILFASDRSLIAEDCPDAAEFPAGGFFVSDDGEIEGTLTTIGASVLLHPELCRAESVNNFMGLNAKLQKVP